MQQNGWFINKFRYVTVRWKTEQMSAVFDGIYANKKILRIGPALMPHCARQRLEHWMYIRDSYPASGGDRDRTISGGNALTRAWAPTARPAPIASA